VIGTVTAALVDLGLLRLGPEPRFHIGLTRGDTLWIDAFIDPQHYFHVKCSNVISLAEEARVYAEAAEGFGNFVPSALGYRVRDGWEIFVTEGVAHRQLFPSDLMNPLHARKWVPALCRFFERSRRNTAPCAQPSTAPALLSLLETQFKDSRFAPILKPWCMGAGQRELEGLGSIRQHCDFVPNNIGVTRAGLVVFDWEDFGKVCLPGLDLCTLVVSCVDVDADSVLVGNSRTLAERCSGLVNPACDALNMEVALFWRLLPFYVLVFLYLKGAYASDVRTRIGALLRRLVSSGSD